MDRHISKHKRATRRQQHVRKKLRGTQERPRLTVFRSNLHIYAQVIDDFKGETLAAAGTLGKKAGPAYGGNKKAAEAVGKAVAEAAMAKGIKQVAFDRGPYQYHGRVKALADAARAAGLKF